MNARTPAQILKIALIAAQSTGATRIGLPPAYFDAVRLLVSAMPPHAGSLTFDGVTMYPCEQADPMEPSAWPLGRTDE